MQRFFAGLVAACAMMITLPLFAETRVALVIGNSAYEHTVPLANPQTDAKDISAKLRSLGFDIVEGYNLTRDEVEDTVRSFARTAATADLSVFYYAGHGISIDNVNYIVPVDAKLSDGFDWEFEVYEVNKVLRYVQRANHASLIFFDACRDNPLANQLAMIQGMGSRSVNSRGMSRIPTEQFGASGSVIAYATEPGQVASDGQDGQNSPFTKALLTHLGAANTDFAVLTSRITGDVYKATDHKQRPRFDISLTGELFLNEIETHNDPVPDPGQPVENNTMASSNSITVQTTFFEAAQRSDDPAMYQTYLDQYPKGVYAVLANAAIARLNARDTEVPSGGGTQIAEADTGFTQETVTRMMSEPLYLKATPAVQAMVASQGTETALAMNKTKRKEVQLRLNLAGQNVGTVDGAWGGKTRTGIRNWQMQNQLQPTGYLNAVQFQMLTANTQASFQAHLAANPNALNPPRASGGSSKKSKNNNTAAVIGGIAAGVVGCKVFGC